MKEIVPVHPAYSSPSSKRKRSRSPDSHTVKTVKHEQARQSSTTAITSTMSTSTTSSTSTSSSGVMKFEELKNNKEPRIRVPAWDVILAHHPGLSNQDEVQILAHKRIKVHPALMLKAWKTRTELLDALHGTTTYLPTCDGIIRSEMDQKTQGSGFTNQTRKIKVLKRQHNRLIRQLEDKNKTSSETDATVKEAQKVIRHRIEVVVMMDSLHYRFEDDS